MSECVCSEQLQCDLKASEAGRSSLDRQLGNFADFRSAMLSKLHEHPALLDWRPCGQEDLGLMLLEMWAYVLDVQSFYDRVHAQESYLRTSRHRSSLRKLVQLLGYTPRPAVAATATLALKIAGRRVVDVPAGTGFRSGAFEDEAPQVFETEADYRLHALNNGWPLKPPVVATISASGSTGNVTVSTLLIHKQTELKVGDRVLISANGASDNYRYARKVTALQDYENLRGDAFKKVIFDQAFALQGNTRWQDIEILRSTQTGGLWTSAHISGDPHAIYGSGVVLDTLYRRLIRADDYVMIDRVGTRRWFQVNSVADVNMTIAAAGSASLEDADGGTATIDIPAVKAPITRLTMKQTVQQSAWNSSDAAKMTLYYGFRPAATVVNESQAELGEQSSLAFDAGRSGGLNPPPGNVSPSGRLLLQDKNDDGALVNGHVDYDSAEFTIDSSDHAAPVGLKIPIKAYGNVVDVSRGESVQGEVLGSGNGALANQFFPLKNGPLTYLDAPTSANEQGLVNTLKIYVDGVLWREKASFFGATAGDRIYVLKQDDEGRTIVHFGDGRHGARLPSGAGNVLAWYRFGAGAAAPPAGSIAQLAKPMDSISEIIQVLSANPGADAESPMQLNTLAPRSSLLLGRAISAEDIEIAAAGVSGVDFAQAQWRWQEKQQRPAIQVWYIGETEPAKVLEKINLLVSPSVPVSASPVQRLPLLLHLDLEIHPDYRENDVLASVNRYLFDNEEGLWQPKKLGIVPALMRSRLFADILAVEGVVNVKAVVVQFLRFALPWVDELIAIPTGTVVDFSLNGVVLNGSLYS